MAFRSLRRQQKIKKSPSQMETPEVTQSDKQEQSHGLASQHCRICLRNTLPLFKVCQCQGHRQYVHEACVIEEMTARMEAQIQLDGVNCQQCGSQYSARVSASQKTLSLSLMGYKLKQIPGKLFLKALIYLVGSVVAVGVLLSALSDQLCWAANTLSYGLECSTRSAPSLTSWFVSLVFPWVFLSSCWDFWGRLRYIWEQSSVEVVEVSLLPLQRLEG